MKTLFRAVPGLLAAVLLASCAGAGEPPLSVLSASAACDMEASPDALPVTWKEYLMKLCGENYAVECCKSGFFLVK